jgi:hypothetical protein
MLKLAILIYFKLEKKLNLLKNMVGMNIGIKLRNMFLMITKVFNIVESVKFVYTRRTRRRTFNFSTIYLRIDEIA